MITIAIPVLNEQETISDQLLKLKEFLYEFPQLSTKLQFVIVDNGSTDDTLQLANIVAKDCEFLEVLHVPKKGVGLALKTAWDQSEEIYVGYMDLDFSTDLDHLHDIVGALKLDPKIDFIYGTRWHKHSVVLNRKKIRLIVSYLFNSLVRFIFGLKYSDFMCGFKFLKRDLYLDLKNSFILEDNWFFCAEILIGSQFINKRAKVYELPIRWTDDLDSRVVIHKVARMFLMSIANFKHQILTKKFFKNDF